MRALGSPWLLLVFNCLAGLPANKRGGTCLLHHVRLQLPPQSTMAAQCQKMPQLGIIAQKTPLHDFLGHLPAENPSINKLTRSNPLQPIATSVTGRHYRHHPCPRFTVFTTHHDIRLNSARALQHPRHITEQPPARKIIEKSQGILMFTFHITGLPILRAGSLTYTISPRTCQV
jgi:hypothetical protein